MRVFLPLRLQQQKNQKERQLFIEQQEQRGDCRNTVEGQTEALEKEDGKESSVAHPYTKENFERKEGSNGSEDDNQEESQTQEGRISNSFGSEEENNHNNDRHEDTNIAVTQKSNQIGDKREISCNHINRRIGSQLEESKPIRRVASSTNQFGNHCDSDKSECLGLNPTEPPLEISGSSTSKQQKPAAHLELSSVLVSAETSVDKTCGVSVAGTECLSSHTYSSRGGAKKRKEQEVEVSIKGDTIQSNNKKICSSTIDIELNHQRKSLNSDTTKEGNRDIPVNTLSASGKEKSQYPSSLKATPTLSNPESSLRNKPSNLDVDQVNPLLIKSSSLYSDCEKKVPIQQPGSPKETSTIFVPTSSPKQIVSQVVTSSQTSKVTNHNTRKSPILHLDSKQAALSETNIALTLNNTGLLKKASTPLVSKDSSSTKVTTTTSRSNLNSNYSGTKISMGIGKGLGDFYISQLQQKSDDGRVENDSNDREEQSNPAMGSNILNAVSYEDRAHLNTSSLPMRDRSQFDFTLSSVSASSTSANVASSASETKGHYSELNSKPSSKHPQKEQSDFSEALKKRGLEEVEQEGDGNCLFRAVSLQVYGDSDAHMDVRRRCMDFMVSLWGSQMHES
uniref:OTU domain-containing protein n=1 Tax=Chaetoceros debilis TaxID=122233 RepID=A0A7S3Q0Y1_9STRA